MRNARFMARRTLRALLLLPLVFGSGMLMAEAITQRDVAKLRLGQRSEEVIRQLGEPMEFARWMDGTRSLVYTVISPGKLAARLYVDVSAEGRVLDIQYGTDDEDN